MNVDIKVQIRQTLSQLLAIDVGATAFLQGRYVEELVIEDKREATFLVVHIVFDGIAFGGHAGDILRSFICAKNHHKINSLIFYLI